MGRSPDLGHFSICQSCPTIPLTQPTAIPSIEYSESPIERTQTKDWANSKETAELIYSEFFSQGDLEKAMGNKPQVGRNVF